MNPRESWIVTEVPALRIIDDALWASVKQRQEEIEAQPAVVASRRPASGSGGALPTFSQGC